jgi:hypothetical protein
MAEPATDDLCPAWDDGSFVWQTETPAEAGGAMLDARLPIATPVALVGHSIGLMLARRPAVAGSGHGHLLQDARASLRALFHPVPEVVGRSCPEPVTRWIDTRRAPASTRRSSTSSSATRRGRGADRLHTQRGEDLRAETIVVAGSAIAVGVAQRLEAVLVVAQVEDHSAAIGHHLLE